MKKTKAKKSKRALPFASLGKVLRELREKNGLTQAGLGEKCEIHAQFVSNWERGLCAPPKHAHKLLAKALNLGPSDPTNNEVRERIWEAAADDYGRHVNRDFGDLI